jgi:hypothetical protein
VRKLDASEAWLVDTWRRLGLSEQQIDAALAKLAAEPGSADLMVDMARRLVAPPDKARKRPAGAGRQRRNRDGERRPAAGRQRGDPMVQKPSGS